MGHADFLTDPLFSERVGPPPALMSPAERRAAALAGTPEERAEFTRTVSINVDGYRVASQFVENLVNRSRRTDRPGGLWLLGEGGVGKSFVLESIYERHQPWETLEARCCPVLTLSFDARPAESDILLSLLLQLGQHPGSLSYQKNADLRDILLDAFPACGVLAILFDESHHLWLSTQAKRVVDRIGGRLGDFLKRLYDTSGLAFIFAGTPGLERLYETDSQAKTRWPGMLKLELFGNDAKFRGLLATLDEALPMPELSGLSEEPLATQLHESTRGNFRLLKNLLADAVLLAASEGAPKLTAIHLAQAHFQTFCTEITPFGPYVPQ